MPAVQRQFEDFHSAICFDEDDEKAKLREKRDTIIKALKANLGDDVPTFTNFNQGSYSMHTGVVPLDGNFDIDVGIIFDCDQNKYPDPVVLKKKVRGPPDHAQGQWRRILVAAVLGGNAAHRVAQEPGHQGSTESGCHSDQGEYHGVGVHGAAFRRRWRRSFG